MNIKNRKKILLLTIIPLLFSCYFSALFAAEFNPRNVSVGVLAFRGNDAAKKRWGPTIDYLNEQLPEYRFNLVPKNLEQLNTLTKNQDIDFILTNTGHYVVLESLYGVTRIATLRNLRQGKALDNFGSVIFTRSDRNDINELADFSGKSFMGVKKNGFGGFQVAWREFKHAGIDPFTDFSSLSFSGFPQGAIAHAVIEGRVDGGTMRTDSLEKMAKAGKIKLEDIKIINAQHPEGFPFLLSSQLYPEWPFSMAQHVPLGVAKKVVIALLQIESNSFAAKQGRYSEWTVPSDYQPVHELMKDLKIGVYAEQDEFNLTTFIQDKWQELLILAVIMVVFLSLLLLMGRKNRALVKAQQLTKGKFKFLANIANETQRVMESLVMQGKGLENEKASPENFLHKMLEASSKTCRFFKDIHDFSQVEAGDAVLVKTKFNLLDILQNVNKDLADWLLEKKITLNITTGEKVPGQLLGDPERLGQIIFNIIRTAMKFSHQGNIDLSVGFVNSSSGKSTLKFEISDANMLINQGQIDMLFDAFVHENALSKQNYGGATLRLYVSKKYIELMDGETWVEKGEGTGVKLGFSSKFDLP